MDAVSDSAWNPAPSHISRHINVAIGNSADTQSIASTSFVSKYPSTPYMYICDAILRVLDL